MATLRRLRPAPPAIKASDCGGKGSFCHWFHLSFYSVLPDTLLGAVRCVTTVTPLLPTAAHHASGQKFSSPWFCSRFVATAAH